MPATNDANQRFHSIGRIFALQDKVTDLAKGFSIDLKTAPASIESQLRTLPQAKLNYLEKNFEYMQSDFELYSEQDIDLWDDKEFFRLSMSRMGVSYPRELMDRIGSEDVVECYDMDRHQVFRNLRFMQGTSYSLLEVLTYDWPTLYERPQVITNMIIKWGERDIFTENRVLDLDIPEHYIRELRSSTPQVLRIRHKYFAPLYCGPNRPFGCVSVCRGDVVIEALNTATDNLSFI